MAFLQNSLANALWPLGAVANLAIDAAQEKKSVGFARPAPFATLAEHVGMQIGCIPRLALVAYLYAHTYGDWRTYARTLDWSWALPIILRDVALCLLVGGIDSFLLLSAYSPFKASMARHKYNPAYPHLFDRNGTSSLLREALWCCCTAAMAGLLEVGVLHASATGRITAVHSADDWWACSRTIFFMVTWFYTQNVQFYCMHRALHAWGTTSIPDIGAWLYRNVHSLHHESKSPTAFSGISMHPLESALYLSYALFPLFFGAHFVAFLCVCVGGSGVGTLPPFSCSARPSMPSSPPHPPHSNPLPPRRYIKTNLIAAAMLGHSAFESPGTGSMPHYLHHSLVGVNYAESHVPLDYFLGTWAATVEEAEASIERRKLKAH
jgi:sterol desaturase/sphingolipid hydroxylase (fatty acid hydroxylase superfamily)